MCAKYFKQLGGGDLKLPKDLRPAVLVLQGVVLGAVSVQRLQVVDPFV